jgi:hypothetical protein
MKNWQSTTCAWRARTRYAEKERRIIFCRPPLPSRGWVRTPVLPLILIFSQNRTVVADAAHQGAYMGVYVDHPKDINQRRFFLCKDKNRACDVRNVACRHGCVCVSFVKKRKRNGYEVRARFKIAASLEVVKWQERAGRLGDPRHGALASNTLASGIQQLRMLARRWI